jgi:L-threonylcarbamoyladenylate synthase
MSKQGHAPGTSLKHYAPRTPVELVDSFDGASASDAVIRFAAAAPKESCIDITLGTEPDTVARGLYEALRNADRAGAKRILVERSPEFGEWSAIADRLRRAAN